MADSTVLWVFVAALITALATGLGALPLLAMKDVPKRWVALSTAAAGGLMLAACHGLIAEGVEIHPGRTLLGLLLGLGAILVGERLAAGAPPVPALAAKGIDPAKALLIVGVMTAHSFAEGVGVPGVGGFGHASGSLSDSACGRTVSTTLVILPSTRSVDRTSPGAMSSVVRTMPPAALRVMPAITSAPNTSPA